MTNITPTLLPTFTYDQLAAAYTIAAERALAAPVGSIARARAVALRERIGNEASRRGLLVRKSFTGSYVVGPASWFEPIR